jgi:hypothetical protein
MVDEDMDHDHFRYRGGRRDRAHFMSKTRLYVECPTCHMQYLLKEIALTYSNGAYIENVAGAPEWQRFTLSLPTGNSLQVQTGRNHATPPLFKR